MSLTIPESLSAEAELPVASFRSRYLRVFRFPLGKFDRGVVASEVSKLHAAFVDYLDEVTHTQLDRARARDVESLGSAAQPIDLNRLREGSSKLPVWEKAEPPDLYFRELLPTVPAFCAATYRRLNPALAKAWFGGAIRVDMTGVALAGSAKKQDISLFASIPEDTGVEIFLSSGGIGVLSIQIDFPSGRSLDFQRVAELNYRMARLGIKNRPALSLPPPKNSEASQLPDAIKASGLLPSTFLGIPGFQFKIDMLAETLLPKIVLEFPGQWLSFTVVRLSSAPDRQTLASALGRLAQVEEMTHPAVADGIVPIPNAALSDHHWAACSSLGSGNIVVDQWPPDPKGQAQNFDTERGLRVHGPYFIAFLCALQQRFGLAWLQKSAHELGVSELLDHRLEGTPAGVLTAFEGLHRQAMAFAVDSHLMDIGYRDALNRFYTLARKAQYVDASHALLSATIRDIESARSRLLQEATLRELAVNQELQKENISELVATQRKVEWIEITILTVYAAEVVHILFETWSKGAEMPGILAVMLAAFTGGIAGLNPLNWAWLSPKWLRISLLLVALAAIILIVKASHAHEAIPSLPLGP